MSLEGLLGRVLLGPVTLASLPPAACPPDTFGKNCSSPCSCQNGGTCDPVAGACRCPPGVSGAHCEDGGCSPSGLGLSLGAQEGKAPPLSSLRSRGRAGRPLRERSGHCRCGSDTGDRDVALVHVHAEPCVWSPTLATVKATDPRARGKGQPGQTATPLGFVLRLPCPPGALTHSPRPSLSGMQGHRAAGGPKALRLCPSGPGHSWLLCWGPGALGASPRPPWGPFQVGAHRPASRRLPQGFLRQALPQEVPLRQPGPLPPPLWGLPLRPRALRPLLPPG